MAVGSFTLYNSGKKDIIDGTIDVDTDTIKAILATTSYTPSAAHDTYSDITNECADGDYSAQTLANAAVTEASGTVTVDADDVSFGSAVSISARYLVLVKQAGGSLVAGDKLLGYMDLDDTGNNVTSTSSNFIVRFHANGLFTLT